MRGRLSSVSHRKQVNETSHTWPDSLDLFLFIFSEMLALVYAYPTRQRLSQRGLRNTHPHSLLSERTTDSESCQVGDGGHVAEFPAVGCLQGLLEAGRSGQ